MDDKTLTALKGSIAKWEAIVDGTGGDRGAGNCALCTQFLDDNDRCHGCPVQRKARRHLCRNTPFERWTKAETRYDFGRGHMATSPEAKAAAAAELDFLRSLLPTLPTRD